jgi:Flp pilus assembly protein TadD
LARRGHHEEALARFDETLKINPKNFAAHLGKGNALAQLGKPDEASLQYRAAADLLSIPNSIQLNSETLNVLGIALSNVGKSDEAIDLFHRAIELAPQKADTYNNLGRVLTVKGNIEEAISTLEQAIRLRPCYPEAFNNLGLVYSQSGYHEDAVMNFALALHCRPLYAKALENLEIAIGAVCMREQKEGAKTISAKEPAL